MSVSYKYFYDFFFMRNTFETAEKVVEKMRKSLLSCEKKYSYVQTGVTNNGKIEYEYVINTIFILFLAKTTT